MAVWSQKFRSPHYQSKTNHTLTELKMSHDQTVENTVERMEHAYG
jgi:hypothetical protein